MTKLADKNKLPPKPAIRKINPDKDAKLFIPSLILAFGCYFVGLLVICFN